MRAGNNGGRDARGARDILAQAQKTTSVRRVYGAPIEHDGIVVIPAASVIGGGGGGAGDTGSPAPTALGIGDEPGADVGEGEATLGTGSGGGYGLIARPVGAYLIRDGQVHWRPAFDVNRFVFWGNMVAIAYFFVRWRIGRARAQQD